MIYQTATSPTLDTDLPTLLSMVSLRMSRDDLYKKTEATFQVALDHKQTHWSKQVSHEKKKKLLLSIIYTGWLIGILIMVYYDPYITG